MAAVPALAALLGGAGCGISPNAIATLPARPPRSASLEEVLAAYDRFAQAAPTLGASGDLEVRDRRRGQARRLGVRLLAARDGRLYLKASVAVVTALEVVCDGRQFWFQVPSKRKVWTGRADQRPGDGEAREPYEALRPADVVAALLPAALDPGPDELLALEADRQGFSLLVAQPVRGRALVRRRAWLERETLQPRRLRGYDARGELETEVQWSNWQEGWPRHVELARPLDGYEAAFDFSKVQPGAALPEQAFRPRTPPDYELVNVDERPATR